jgi:hypothetical protein
MKQPPPPRVCASLRRYDASCVVGGSKNFTLDEISTSMHSRILDENFQTKSFIKRRWRWCQQGGGVELLPLSSQKVESRVLAINSEPLLMTNLKMKWNLTAFKRAVVWEHLNVPTQTLSYKGMNNEALQLAYINFPSTAISFVKSFFSDCPSSFVDRRMGLWTKEIKKLNWRSVTNL